MDVVAFLGVPYADKPDRFAHSIMKESLDGALFKAHEFGNQVGFELSSKGIFGINCENNQVHWR